MKTKGMTVTIHHAQHGEIVLTGVTEIHWSYPSFFKDRGSPSVAFESDIRGTGNTYECADILEFEAISEE